MTTYTKKLTQEEIHNFEKEAARLTTEISNRHKRLAAAKSFDSDFLTVWTQQTNRMQSKLNAIEKILADDRKNKRRKH